MNRAVRRFLRMEDGSATIEFVILFPAFVILLLSGFELGMTLLRQGMLDRGLDLAVRAVRIGNLDPVTHERLKASICENTLGLIPDCRNQIRLEMAPADPRNWSLMPADADCADRANAADPVRTFVPGKSNVLMMLRACALFDPYFPTTGLGAALQKGSGFYALVSTTAFVVEPRRN